MWVSRGVVTGSRQRVVVGLARASLGPTSAWTATTRRAAVRAEPGLILLGGLLGACGPAVSLDDPRGPEPTGTGGSGSTASPGGTSSSGGAPSDSTTDDGPRLDVMPLFDLGAAPKRPMYAPCYDDEECMDGLQCVTLKYEKLLVGSICTVPCEDPMADCEPAPDGWMATCALHVEDGQLDVCAIACDVRSYCPGGYCMELFGPRGESQDVCVP